MRRVDTRFVVALVLVGAFAPAAAGAQQGQAQQAPLLEILLGADARVEHDRVDHRGGYGDRDRGSWATAGQRRDRGRDNGSWAEALDRRGRDGRDGRYDRNDRRMDSRCREQIQHTRERLRRQHDQWHRVHDRQRTKNYDRQHAKLHDRLERQARKELSRCDTRGGWDRRDQARGTLGIPRGQRDDDGGDRSGEWRRKRGG